MVTLLTQVDTWFLHIMVGILAIFTAYILGRVAVKIEKVVDKIIEMDKRLTVIEFACPKIHKYEEKQCKDGDF